MLEAGDLFEEGALALEKGAFAFETGLCYTEGVFALESD